MSGDQPAATAPATFNAIAIGGVAVRSDVSSSVRSGDRIGELDVVKGILVLVMVLYHWINYYVGLDWPGYRYLRFLTPSFIFLTGFLVSNVHLPKYADAPGLMYRRLTVRGLKLLGLFACANVLLSLIFGLPFLFNDLAGGLVFGTVPVAFDILLSIAYFLLLSPAVLILTGRSRTPLFGSAALVLTAASLLNASGVSNAHVELIAIGLLGLSAGMFHLRPTASRVLLPVIAGYAVYVAAVHRWHALYELQIVGVVLSLAALWLIALACRLVHTVHRELSRVGRYSLALYMAQIVLLRLFTLSIPPQHDISLLGEVSFISAIPLAAATVMMFGIAFIADALRHRFGPAERLYRAVFA